MTRSNNDGLNQPSIRRNGSEGRSTAGIRDADARDVPATADVLTIKEAAVVLRCSKAHLQNLLAGRIRGTPPLPFIPIGRRKLIRRDSLLRWMERVENAC